MVPFRCSLNSDLGWRSGLRRTAPAPQYEHHHEIVDEVVTVGFPGEVEAKLILLHERVARRPSPAERLPAVLEQVGRVVWRVQATLLEVCAGGKRPVTRSEHHQQL